MQTTIGDAMFQYATLAKISLRNSLLMDSVITSERVKARKIRSWNEHQKFCIDFYSKFIKKYKK